jgi:hypothetical protein
LIILKTNEIQKENPLLQIQLLSRKYFQLYTFNPNSIHFFVLIADNNKVDINALKIRLADFNSKYHSLETLQVNSLILDGHRK